MFTVTGSLLLPNLYHINTCKDTFCAYIVYTRQFESVFHLCWALHLFEINKKPVTYRRLSQIWDGSVRQLKLKPEFLFEMVFTIHILVVPKVVKIYLQICFQKQCYNKLFIVDSFDFTNLNLYLQLNKVKKSEYFINPASGSQLSIWLKHTSCVDVNKSWQHECCDVSFIFSIQWIFQFLWKEIRFGQTCLCLYTE